MGSVISILDALGTLFVGIVKGNVAIKTPAPAIPAMNPMGLAMRRSMRGIASSEVRVGGLDWAHPSIEKTALIKVKASNKTTPFFIISPSSFRLR